ncbi:Mut7-C RNAse domain-containing protein [Pseudoduganella sp.]|uniref:Mut7-C RNAse domain-containing protein n=1 Tax=Pseudoduganella sp. TaxID=1880898 RepID=UPI0035ADAC99
MASATFRFDPALHDFLPRARRGVAFTVQCARAATTKHMIEALGVPHTEVGTVLVNGAPAGLAHLLRDGDRVEVLPPPAGCAAAQAPRFVADAHLGGLARLLRMAGFDTLYDNNIDDPTVATLSADEGRIALTRDRDLLKRRGITQGCYVRALKPALQFAEIFQRLDLAPSARPFTLCLACNAPLRPVAKAAIAGRLPPSVRAAHDEFLTCDVCRGVFWRGSHWRRMAALLASQGIQAG